MRKNKFGEINKAYIIGGFVFVVVILVILFVVLGSSSEPPAPAYVPPSPSAPSAPAPAYAPSAPAPAYAPSAPAPSAPGYAPPAPPLAPSAPAPAPVVETPLVQVIPYVKGSETRTNSDSHGGGNGKVIYLDRHNIDCNSSGGINRFLYQDDKGKLYYKYNCASGGSLDAASTTSTTSNAGNKDASYYYLDRHEVKCPDNSVLSQFKLARPDGNNIRYDYSCKKSKVPLNCKPVSTIGNDDGGGKMWHLDRHDVKCADNEVLSGFKMTRLPGSKIQYNYNCCL